MGERKKTGSLVRFISQRNHWYFFGSIVYEYLYGTVPREAMIGRALTRAALLVVIPPVNHGCTSIYLLVFFPGGRAN